MNPEKGTHANKRFRAAIKRWLAWVAMAFRFVKDVDREEGIHLDDDDPDDYQIDLEFEDADEQHDAAVDAEEENENENDATNAHVHRRGGEPHD